MIMELKRLVKVTAALAVMYACAFLGYQFARLEPSFSALASEQHVRRSPTLIAAVTEADSAAGETARVELAKWREKVMERVDPEFLDWFFSYYQWRGSGAVWVWRRMTGGKEYADNKYIQEIADAFAEKVMSPKEIEAEAARIARAAATMYRDRLVRGIAAVRDRFALVDAELDNIGVVGGDNAGRSVLVSLHEIASRGATSKKAIDLLA